MISHFGMLFYTIWIQDALEAETATKHLGVCVAPGTVEGLLVLLHTRTGERWMIEGEHSPSV